MTKKGAATFHGMAVIRFFRWYPTESKTAAVEDHIAITLGAGKSATISKSVSLPSPRLWDYENPNLYKVTITLVNSRGMALDDYVVTTGIRTISEEGGTFRINGKEEVLNGVTWMQFPAPLTKSTTWHRCCPREWIVKGILMTRAMQGNTIRKHEASSSYSDPRFAEIGDQLGMMYANGEGATKDDAEAVRWFRLSAEQGTARAQLNVGVMYANGDGVPEDLVYSYMWLNLSTAQGNENARENKDIIEQRMTREQIAEAQRLSREWIETHPQDGP